MVVANENETEGAEMNALTRQVNVLRNQGVGHLAFSIIASIFISQFILSGTLQAVSSRMSRDGGVVVDDRSSDSRTVLWRTAWKRRAIRPSISNRRIAEYILHEILRCNTLMAHMQSFLIPTVRLCPASCRGLATQKGGASSMKDIGCCKLCRLRMN